MVHMAKLLESCRTSGIAYRTNISRSHRQIPIPSPIQAEAVIFKSSPHSMYISFRGTCSAQDLIHALDVRPKQLAHNIQVHQGFYRKYKSLEKEIAKEIEAHDDVHEIVFTGHSMGGSVAMIAAYHFAREQKRELQIRCHTFGAPKTGSPSFMQQLHNEIDEVVCVSLRKDIIPRIPLNPIFTHEEGHWIVDDNMIPVWDLLQNHSCVSYYHVLTKYIIDRENNIRV